MVPIDLIACLVSDELTLRSDRLLDVAGNCKSCACQLCKKKVGKPALTVCYSNFLGSIAEVSEGFLFLLGQEGVEHFV